MDDSKLRFGFCKDYAYYQLVWKGKAMPVGAIDSQIKLPCKITHSPKIES